MESYIIRVYRRGRGQLSDVAGLVETVGEDQGRSFASLNELMQIVRKAISGDHASSIVELEGYKNSKNRSKTIRTV